MSKKEEALLQFAPMQSSVDEGFWHRFSSLKLNKLGIDDSPLPIIEPCSGNRNTCSVPGILYNTNTAEGFHALDKMKLLKEEVAKVITNRPDSEEATTLAQQKFLPQSGYCSTFFYGY
ncbi:hypothetical protein HN51_034872 [Arachis hypogaea]|nr:Ubiquitin-like modifier-activating enzyme [Arachis hypogaea]